MIRLMEKLKVPSTRKFTLGKLSHHQTVMPLIFECLSYKDTFQMLHQTSKLSREFLTRQYPILSLDKDDLRVLLGDKERQKVTIKEFNLSKSNRRLYFAFYTESGHVIVGGGIDKILVLSPDIK